MRKFNVNKIKFIRNLLNNNFKQQNKLSSTLIKQ